MKDSHVAVLAWMVGIVMFFAGALLTAMFLQEEPGESWQAALQINNWTNRTLDLTVYVFASETVQYELTIEHEANATLVVTWQDVEETMVFIHAIGEGVDGWLVYDLHPGEWQSVVLI